MGRKFDKYVKSMLPTGIFVAITTFILATIIQWTPTNTILLSTIDVRGQVQTGVGGDLATKLLSLIGINQIGIGGLEQILLIAGSSIVIVIVGRFVYSMIGGLSKSPFQRLMSVLFYGFALTGIYMGLVGLNWTVVVVLAIYSVIIAWLMTQLAKTKLYKIPDLSR